MSATGSTPGPGPSNVIGDADEVSRAQPETSSLPRVQEFRRSLAELVSGFEVPGVSAAVYSSRGLESAEVFGIRRARHPAPVELTDRFFIGSITKPMTATLAALMVDEGAVAWTTTPGNVWPGDAARMHPTMERVTLAQLLSHRAGVQPFTSDDELAAGPPLSGPARDQRAAFARWLLERPPASAVGEQTYSNAGFGLAAAMLEEASGQAWEDLLRERIFRRLGLTSCGFGWPRSAGEQPHGHRLHDGRYVEGNEGDSPGLPASIAPAGAVHCTMADLGRFGVAHLLGMLGQPTFLQPETVRTMHPAVESEDYVLGWNRQPAGSSHLGGVTEGWHASLFVSEAADLVVAVAVNAREPGTTDELMQSATQLAFDTFATRRLS